MRASIRLHSDMFSRLLRAPCSFFDSSPAGTILNRFSKDAGAVDEALPTVMMDVVVVSAQPVNANPPPPSLLVGDLSHPLMAGSEDALLMHDAVPNQQRTHNKLPTWLQCRNFLLKSADGA